MQVTETLSDGLKREYKVVVPKSDLEAKLDSRLAEMKDRVQLKGFRPGKVPVAHIKKIYGKSVMAEAIEAMVRETNAKIIADNSLKLAMEPKVNLPENQEEIEKIIAGGSDLSYTVALEVLPAITLADFKTISLERPVADVAEAEVDETLNRMAAQTRGYHPKGDGAAVENEDKVTISFTGKLDGVPFEGGTGEDIGVNVGSKTFIPGFEEQLIGMKAGDDRTITVRFPNNYLSEQLAGKEATFDVTAKSVEAPDTSVIDDELAKKAGLESLEKLKEAVREQLGRNHTVMSRNKLKRELLDKLDALHQFTPPPTMLEEEFTAVWSQVTGDLDANNKKFEDEGTTEEKAREEYRKIADRRVRLGLVLAEIGEKNSIKVSEDELSRAVVDQARQHPGHEQQVWDYYRKNPQAMGQLRAPLFEEKVVDFITELATVTEKKVSREELFKQDDEQPAA